MLLNETIFFSCFKKQFFYTNFLNNFPEICFRKQFFFRFRKTNFADCYGSKVSQLAFCCEILISTKEINLIPSWDLVKWTLDKFILKLLITKLLMMILFKNLKFTMVTIMVLLRWMSVVCLMGITVNYVKRQERSMLLPLLLGFISTMCVHHMSRDLSHCLLIANLLCLLSCVSPVPAQ